MEATAKTAKVGLAIKSAVTTIKPGPTIVTFWQGIADLIIRGVLVVSKVHWIASRKFKPVV